MRQRVLTFVGLVMMACLPSLSVTAKADTVTFTYTVTGNANAMLNGSVLGYKFSQTTTINTVLGALIVTPQGSGFDLTKVNPDGTISGTAIENYAFAGLGTFTGTGTEFLGASDAQGNAPFFGTTKITGGTGIFAGATGTSTYTGTFNAVTGIGTFTETVTISAPGLTAPVPEPATMMLLGTGLAGMATKLRRKRNRHS